MLENDHLMFAQQLLFIVNIDKKIRIVRVQIVYGDVLLFLRRLQQDPIRYRLLRFRMGVKQQNFCWLRHSYPLPKRRHSGAFPLPCTTRHPLIMWWVN